ncbi:PadR family transcriptional regulator [Aquibacillus koreensis]|uniref:PadR family transcriptional regulator n=1 Tax=Aquibacillus koreensis TaxID=279446 RepID=A0A9X3WK86_9BACI|nr:PadR family transcriptional regulator [Aquibacillus koreensis]MCT2535550.1 PadR family transcriptional regulator [Aquibacillus koreensis]MDC3420165.1 PadR family transcriptional regulator [Aquibacillus koreensis]
MTSPKIINDYLPLTHTTYYILLALHNPLHGYGIMQKVEEMSEGEVRLGPGTLYGALSKLEKQKLIEKTTVEDRRKCYVLTSIGEQVVIGEYTRLKRLLVNTKQVITNLGGEET